MVRRERLESPISSPVAMPQGRTLVLSSAGRSEPKGQPVASQFDLTSYTHP